MSLRTRRIVVAALCFVLLAAGITVFVRKGASSEASPAKTAKVLKIAEAKKGQKCPEGFVVKLAGNKGQKLDDAHQAKVNALLVKYQGKELNQKVLEMHLKLAKRDPRFLYMVVQAIPDLEPVADLKSESDISKKGCYTAKGREAWKLLRGALVTSVVIPEAEAPAEGVNTGVNEGGVYQTDSGITGDRSAVQYEMKNGFSFWIMHRCGNLVVMHTIPGVPTTAPPTTNPPGTNPSRTTAPPHGGTTVTSPPHSVPPPPHVTTTTRPGKDPSQGIGNNAGAASQGDTGHRTGGDTPANPPVNTPPPVTYGTVPSQTTLPPPAPGPSQPPVEDTIPSPPTAPD